MNNILRFLTPKSRVAYIEDDSTVRQALEKMRHHGYNALPVIDKEGHYVGTLTEGDFLWFLLEKETAALFDLEKIPVHSLIRPDWNRALPISATLGDLLEKVRERNFAPIVDDRGCFIGLITRRDVLAYLAGEWRKTARVELPEEHPLSS